MPRGRRTWTAKEDAQLRSAVNTAMLESRPLLWRELAKSLPGRSNKDCRRRWWNSLAEGVNRGTWSEQEDERLTEAVQRHGHNWSQVAKSVGSRNPDQCSSHWTQVLDPSINYSDWTEDEDTRLLNEVVQSGTNWMTIAATHHPRRTGLALKNRYSTLKSRKPPPKGNAAPNVEMGSLELPNMDTIAVSHPASQYPTAASKQPERDLRRQGTPFVEEDDDEDEGDSEDDDIDMYPDWMLGNYEPGSSSHIRDRSHNTDYSGPGYGDFSSTMISTTSESQLIPAVNLGALETTPTSLATKHHWPTTIANPENPSVSVQIPDRLWSSSSDQLPTRTNESIDPPNTWHMLTPPNELSRSTSQPSFSNLAGSGDLDFLNEQHQMAQVTQPKPGIPKLHVSLDLVCDYRQFESTMTYLTKIGTSVNLKIRPDQNEHGV